MSNYTEVACVSQGNLSHWKGQKEDGNCYLGVLPAPFSDWIKLYVKSNEPDQVIKVAEPLYMTKRAKRGGGWVESTKAQYDETADWNRRIVYQSPIFKDRNAADIDLWIKVEDQLPEVGDWVNVLVDNQDGDFWDKRKNPRYEVYGAQLREVDSEGYADWQRWVMSDGGPMGRLRNVTHWKPYPLPPKE